MMLVGADDGAIDIVEQPVELAAGSDLPLEDSKDALPKAGQLSAIEAAGHRLPGHSVAQDQYDAVDEDEMSMG